MEEIICDISAFRYYRTPPSVCTLFGELPIARDQVTRRNLIKQPFVQHVLGAPLHVLVDDLNECNSAKTIKRHLWTSELPAGAMREIEGDGSFTSPEMTLLLMARWLSAPRLALAMYEFCGAFTVYKPKPALAELLKQAGAEHIDFRYGWQQVRDSKGNLTSLWKRPPLLSLEKLQRFSRVNAGACGGRTFKRAAGMVAGMTRSPLEAEAALLLSTSRRLGGYGLKFETNHPIRLTPSARRIYRHDYCEADIYIESPDGSKIVDIECQGAAVHAGEAASISDANRTTALESMGISVVQITFQDIRSAERLEIIVQHVAAKLGIAYHEKTEKMNEAERALRKELPTDWLELTEVK